MPAASEGLKGSSIGREQSASPEHSAGWQVMDSGAIPAPSTTKVVNFLVDSTPTKKKPCWQRPPPANAPPAEVVTLDDEEENGSDDDERCWTPVKISDVKVWTPLSTSSAPSRTSAVAAPVTPQPSPVPELPAAFVVDDSSTEEAAAVDLQSPNLCITKVGVFKWYFVVDGTRSDGNPKRRVIGYILADQPPEFLALWPEFAGLELVYNTRKDHYDKLKAEVANGKLLKGETDAEAKARLRESKLSFEKAIARIERFVLLTRKASAELRKALADGVPFNVLFRRVSYPGETVKDPLRNDLYDWDEEVQVQRSTRYWYYYDKKLESIGVETYHCLFEGCQYAYVSVSKRRRRFEKSMCHTIDVERLHQHFLIHSEEEQNRAKRAAEEAAMNRSFTNNVPTFEQNAAPSSEWNSSGFGSTADATVQGSGFGTSSFGASSSTGFGASESTAPSATSTGFATSGFGNGGFGGGGASDSSTGKSTTDTWGSTSASSGFGTPAADSSTTASSGFANAGFGNGGFGAKQDTSAAVRTDTDKPNSGFGNAAAGFGNSSFGNPSTSSPSTTNTGFGSSSIKTATAETQSSGFANGGFGGSGFGNASKSTSDKPHANENKSNHSGFGAPSTAKNSTSGNFASAGFGSSTTASNNDGFASSGASSGFANSGFGNSGFGNNSTPAPSKGTSNNGFGNAPCKDPASNSSSTGFANSGFGNGGFGGSAANASGASGSSGFGGGNAASNDRGFGKTNNSSSAGGFANSGNAGFGSSSSSNKSDNFASKTSESGGFGNGGFGGGGSRPASTSSGFGNNSSLGGNDASKANSSGGFANGGFGNGGFGGGGARASDNNSGFGNKSSFGSNEAKSSSGFGNGGFGNGGSGNGGFGGGGAHANDNNSGFGNKLISEAKSSGGFGNGGFGNGGSGNGGFGGGGARANDNNSGFGNKSNSEAKSSGGFGNGGFGNGGFGGSSSAGGNNDSASTGFGNGSFGGGSSGFGGSGGFGGGGSGARSGGSGCRNCGQEGHFARECPEKKKSNGCRNCGEDGHFAKDCSQPRVPTCFNCEQKGHVSRNCPEPRKEGGYRGGHRGGGNSSFSSSANDSFGGGGGFGSSSFGGDSSGGFSNAPRGRFGNNRGGGNSRDGDSQSGFGSSGFGGGDGQGSSRGGFRGRGRGGGRGGGQRQSGSFDQQGGGSSGFGTSSFGNSSNSENPASGFGNGGFGQSSSIFGSKESFAPKNNNETSTGFGNSDSTGFANSGFGNSSFGQKSNSISSERPKSSSGQRDSSSGFSSGGFGQKDCKQPPDTSSGFGNAGFGNGGFGQSDRNPTIVKQSTGANRTTESPTGFGNTGFGNSGFGKSNATSISASTAVSNASESAASSFGTSGFGNSSCGQPANADSKNKSDLSNNPSDDASRGHGANTEPLGKRCTFGGDDSSPSHPNAGASFAGFDASNGPGSNTSGGSFANAGFGNAGFGAPPSTNNSCAPSVTSSSGFGNSATKDSAGGFGSSNPGATNQANSSSSAPEASGGFATTGFGQPASQPPKPAEGFGNAGFGAPSQPPTNPTAPSSSFGNAAGFGNAGFGAPPTPNASAANSATEAHSEPPLKEINWDNTSSHDTADSGPEPVVPAAPANIQGGLVPPPHIPPEMHQQWMHDMHMYRMHQMHMRARDPISRPNLLLKKSAKRPSFAPTPAGTAPPSNSFAQDDGKKSDSTEAVNDAKDAGKETEKDAASAENKPTTPPDQETPADPYADELIRTALASIPMLETEEQKAQKRKERAQAILRSKGKELVENVITGVKREKQSDLDRSEVRAESSFSLQTSDKQDADVPKMQFSFPLNMPESSSPPDADTNVAFWPELSPEPEPTTDPEEASQVLTGDLTVQPLADNSGSPPGDTVSQPVGGTKPQEPDASSTANKPEAPKAPSTKPANTGILAKMRKKMTAMQPWLHRQMSLEQQKSSKKSATPTVKRACARPGKQLSDDSDTPLFDKTIFALATDLSHDEKMNVGHFVGGKFMCPEPVLKYVADCGCVFKFRRCAESALVKGADEYYCVACDVYFKKDTRVLVKDGRYVEFDPGQIGVDGDEHECVDADLPCVLKHRRHAHHRSAPVKEKPKPTCRRTKKAPPKQRTPSPERSSDSDSSPEPPHKRSSEAIDLEVKYPGPTETKYIDFPIHSSPLYRQPITAWSTRPSSDARLLRKQWPEFQKLYDEYNGVWNKYLQYLYEVEGMHPAMDCDSLTTKELERRFLDLKKTNGRIQAFVKLTKEQPKELRHMLQQKKGVDEAFRVFLSPDEVEKLIVKRSRGELVTTPESASDGEEVSSPEIGADADVDLDAPLIDPDEVEYNDHFNRRTVNLCLQFQCRVDGCGYRYYDSPSRRKDLVGHYLDKHVPKEQILPTYFEKQKPRQSDSAPQGTRKRQSEDDDVEMMAEPSPPAKKKKDEDVPKLRQDWPEYCRLEEKVTSRKRAHTLLKTKVEQLKFDDENWSAKFEEVDQRRNAVQKAEQRRDRFAELARQKPAELRELLSQGASINEVFLQMGTGRGDMLLEELIDSEEDREAEKKKNKKQESSQPAQETKDEEDDDLKWTEIDPEVFFERTELKGGTFRFTCKVDECGYKYSPSAKLLPETMLARLRQHFTEKHTGTRNGGPDQEKSYTCWEEWPQLAELYQRHKGLVHAVKNPKTGKEKRAALEAELKKSEHRYKCVRALIRFSTLPFHALIFEGLPLDEILKQLSYRLPASLQPEEEEEEASEFPQQAATIEPVDEVPSTSKGHDLDVDLSSFPETSIELQALYKLDVLEYTQFFELTDAGVYKCLFVDCDYAFKSSSSVKDPSYQLKRHCTSFHF